MDTSSKRDKPEIIAQIDIQWPEVKTQDWMDEYLSDHFNCVLCGSTMTFKHKTDFVAQTVNEEAHCHSCGVRNRQDLFTLQ